MDNLQPSAPPDPLREALRRVLSTPGVWVGMAGKPHAEGCICVLCEAKALVAEANPPEVK